MLYVVKTDHDGRVQALWPCDNGIDEALDLIANAATSTSCSEPLTAETLTNYWNSCVRLAEKAGGDAHELFVFPSHGFLYGLATAPDVPGSYERELIERAKL